MASRWRIMDMADVQVQKVKEWVNLPYTIGEMELQPKPIIGYWTNLEELNNRTNQNINS